MGHQNGELGGVRTRDHLIKSQMLYQLSYQPTQPDGLNQVAELSYVGASVCQTFFAPYLQFIITARFQRISNITFGFISYKPSLLTLGLLGEPASLQLSHVLALKHSKKPIQQYQQLLTVEILYKQFRHALCHHKSELH